MFPVLSNEILGCIQFKNEIEVEKNGFYGVHFRLDLDCIVHYLFEANVYKEFMEGKKINLLRYPEFVNYVNRLFDQYIYFMDIIGFDKPWYICTSIGKSDVHNIMIPMLYKLRDYIRMNNGISILNSHYKERELNAIVDLLHLKNAEKRVGFRGSSFSEGYCCKVGPPERECYFVDGSVKKIFLIDI
jgi:hypothetical protein